VSLQRSEDLLAAFEGCFAAGKEGREGMKRERKKEQKRENVPRALTSCASPTFKP